MSKYVWVVRDESQECTDSVHSTLKGAREYLADAGYGVLTPAAKGWYEAWAKGTRAERDEASAGNDYYTVSKFAVRKRKKGAQ